jgi:methionyl aminopeptidase
MSGLPCAAASCNRPGSLRCPTCVSSGVTPESLSYFCSQDCFRASWKTHKLVHKMIDVAPRGLQASSAARAKRFESFRYTGLLRVADVIMPLRTVPANINPPDYANHPRGVPVSEEKFNGSSVLLNVLDADGIAGMREACRLAREVLDIAVRMANPGVTTEAIDNGVHQACIERNCYPSPLNYYGFPKSCCTSVNEVICHGIPDCRPLEDGDILNIDITVYHNGYHGDLNETHVIGTTVDEGSKKLIRSAHDSMWAAIRMVKPGVLFREFGATIEKVARSRGHSVVRSYCGHGIGRLFHTAPNVPHYRKNKAVGVVREGMTFTIEPMLCANGWKDVTWPDNWTAVTEDGSRSAQFEHTVLVTASGCEVLTDRLSSSPKLWWEVDGSA